MKTVSFSFTPRANVREKNNLFLAKMSNVHIDEPQNVQSQNDHSNNFYYHYNDKKMRTTDAHVLHFEVLTCKILA